MEVAGTPDSAGLRRGVLLVGHGTRDRRGQDEFLATVALITELLPDWVVQPGFLELATPTLDEAVERLVADGVTDCIVTPLLLFAAGHAKRDVPELIESSRRRFPSVTFRQASHLGCHMRLLELSARRFAEARRIIASIADDEGANNRPGIAAAGQLAAQDEGRQRQQTEQSEGTLLILVGRGSLDAEATAEMERYAALCGERVVATVRAGFVSMARPALDDVLAETVQSLQSSREFSRVVVQPHFLFAGELLETVRRKTMAAAAAGGGEWYLAAHLGPAKELAEAVVARTVDIASSAQNY